MPLQATSGAASYDGFGGGVPFTPTYIEDVFSTWLYTGNGSTQTITNGINLSGKGGLVWTKVRDSATYGHVLTSNANGWLESNSTAADAAPGYAGSGFLSNGFNTISAFGNFVNWSGHPFVSWTFRKQPKFFDVVTWTGNGSALRSLSHSLGSVPGFIVVKKTSNADNWGVYHRSLPAAGRIVYLNSTFTDSDGYVGFTPPTSTTFNVGGQSGISGGTATSNANGETYVAYLFAHNAGGFGLTGTDNVISCGSFTTDGSGNATVSLGYEPQWVLIKQTDGVDSWYLNDNMRGMAVSGNQPNLSPNLTAAESAGGYNTYPNATGFTASVGIASKNYIYVAIRRGPMKTPTTGTSVYSAVTRTGTGAAANVTAGFAPDLLFYSPNRSGSSGYAIGWFDRLRGTTQRLASNTTGGESNYGTDSVTQFGSTGVTLGVDSLSTGINFSGQPSVDWMLGRAPGFFDVVCYTGNNVYQQAQSHNLGVAPELIIVKRRDATANWGVGCNFTNTEFQYLNLNSGADGGNTNAYTTGGFFGGKPTASTFILAQNAVTNASGGTYVAYLFATLAGVSKVGTYTGTGALQTINCGFTGGARFVLIKRLGDNVDPGIGGWYVYDSARGITSGNDPYLLLNSTAAEVTGTNYVDTTSVGFQVTAAAPAAINASGGTFLFLAVA